VEAGFVGGAGAEGAGLKVMFWPFKRKKTASDNPDRVLESIAVGPCIQVDKKMGRVEVVGGDFYSFSFSESPNGEYLVACRDSCLESHRGGARYQGHGAFILAHQQRLLFEKHLLERPMESAVANNGHFVINDWRFDSSQLRGTFYAFDATGEVLIKQDFAANLMNNAISSDGAFAVCGCANNSAHEDGGAVALFDLRLRQCLWKQRLPTGPFVEHYDFDTAQRVLTVTYGDGRRYRYGFDGAFLDRQAWDTERMKTASLSLFLADYQQAFQALNLPTAENTAPIIQDIQHLLAVNEDPYLPNRAKALRLLGEIHEALADKKQALVYYQQALEKDDKVGVKKKIKNLSQDLHG